jgi:hypothetical protein
MLRRTYIIPHVHCKYLVWPLDATRHSCARALLAILDPLGRLLEGACALALGQAGTVRLVRDPDRCELHRLSSNHLSLCYRQAEGQRAFQQEDVASPRFRT